MTSEKPRCPWAITYGAMLTTRCKKDLNHESNLNDSTHVGRGLREFPNQNIRWLDGDPRQFVTIRDDIHSWEEHVTQI